MDFQTIYQQDKGMIDQALNTYFSDSDAPFHHLL